MEPNKIEDFRLWYSQKRPVYNKLGRSVKDIIENLLEDAKIDFLHVTYRAKEIDSSLKKVENKEYTIPEEEVMDLVGIRIITYIEADIKKVCKIIEESFKVIPEHSHDKSAKLKHNEVGYRSVHYVCALNEDRLKLPEFKVYKELLFEVQIRTVLQHAWAEIEHDRNYKFAGVLPDDLKRRLYALAGVLELVDREFVSLSEAIDEYSKEVKEKTEANDIKDIEITTISLMEYLPKKASSLGIKVISQDIMPEEIKAIPEELKKFGINTLAELDNLFTQEVINLIKDNPHPLTYTPIVRRAMLFTDIDTTFKLVAGNTPVLNEHMVELLSKKYGENVINNAIKQYSVRVDGCGTCALNRSFNDLPH